MTRVLYLVAFATSALAGTVVPELEQTLASAKPDDRIDIVVQTTLQGDLNQLPPNTSYDDKVGFLQFVARRAQRDILGYLETTDAGEVRTFWLVSRIALTASPEVIRALAAREDVGFVTDDFVVRLDDRPTPPEEIVDAPDWNITKVSADQCWSAGFDGTGIVVGNIDTGVLVTHAAFHGRWRSTNGWFDGVNGQPSPYDDNDHGTHTMGTICGGDGPGPDPNDIGVAPGATFICAKGFNSSGNGQASWIDACINWMAGTGRPDVCSNSWGSSDRTAPYFFDSFNNMRSLGIIVAASIGNPRPGASTSTPPGSFPCAIGSGATTSTDALASFSSRGPAPNLAPWTTATEWPRSDWNRYNPGISAPGQSVRSSLRNGSYGNMNGTSMACPHVAGAAAVMLQKSSNLAHNDVFTLVTDWADEPAGGGPYPNNNYGWGRLNVKAALDHVMPMPTLSGISPNSANRLQTLDVVFTGTNYIQGVSTAQFGPGITINSNTVNSSTQLTANVTIDAGAATGPRSVHVANSGPGGGSSGDQTFTVNNPGPTLSGISPSFANRCQTLDVVFTGTNYIQGASSVVFGDDISLISVTVTSASQLTARITVEAGAATGARNVSVTNSGPGGGNSGTQVFSVNNPAPVLLSIDPAAGNRLQTLDVVFTGDNYFGDATSVGFGDGIRVNSVTVNSLTELTASITIEVGAATGPRDVSVTNALPGGGTAVLEDRFTVGTPVPSLTAVDPNAGVRTRTMDVVLSGDNYFTDATTVGFGDNIQVNSVLVNGLTELTASITIEAGAATGARDVSVTNAAPGGGTATLDDGFVVYPLKPAAFGLLTPADGQTEAPCSGNLTWEPSAGAESYDVYLGLSSPPPLYAENIGDVTTWPYRGLQVYGKYHWAVIARNDNPEQTRCDADFEFLTTAGFEQGWVEMQKSVPGSAAVKDGAWLVVGQPGTDALPVVYVAKGNKSVEFQSYDPIADAWASLADINAVEAGREKPPKKGCAATSDGERYIYMTKGNNTLGFWKYSISGDSWQRLPDVPLGAGKKVKGGNDLAFVKGDTDYVYLLKGYGTEFYRFDTERGRWDTLDNVPYGVAPRYNAGSFLVCDGAGALYAHQAKYTDATRTHHYMFRYNLGAQAWVPEAGAKGMPVPGMDGGKMKLKKSKDGGAGAWFDDALYALKGGNTCQFYVYEPVGDTWTELDTIDSYGSTLKKKKVKAGGDLASYGFGVFFALKGNKTNEFWRYVEPTGAYGLPLTADRSGVQAGELIVHRSSFIVSPSPLSSGFATLRYSLPRPGPVSVTVFDVAGRSVFRTGTLGRLTAGTLPLDLRGLSAGIYLVRLDADGFGSSEKLVVHR